METFIWIITAIWLGAGLAMDACAASMSNGLSEPNMKRKKSFLIAGLFGFFQILMPILGYLIITILVNKENRNDDDCSIMIQDNINVENYVDEKLIHQNDFSYTLIAINVHLGSNNSGHYKAQIFNKNKWYLYDDGNCQEISEDERKQGVTYIYQRNPTPSKIIK